jgi:hypothetical protein
VLYLDRFIQDAELLQAIARVNRTAQGKSAGFLIDYFGVGAHLQTALQAYAPEDAEDAIGAFASITDEVPKLRASPWRRPPGHPCLSEESRDRPESTWDVAADDDLGPGTLDRCQGFLGEHPGTLRSKRSLAQDLKLPQGAYPSRATYGPGQTSASC